jgi:hypothetical protein
MRRHQRAVSWLASQRSRGPFASLVAVRCRRGGIAAVPLEHGSGVFLGRQLNPDEPLRRRAPWRASPTGQDGQAREAPAGGATSCGRRPLSAPAHSSRPRSSPWMRRTPRHSPAHRRVTRTAGLAPPAMSVVAPGTLTPRATGPQPPAQATRSELPGTGADVDRLVVAGLAATTGRAALVLWSADAKAGGAWRSRTVRHPVE